MGGIDVERMRARGLVAYAIQLKTSDSHTAHSEELGQMLKRSPALVNRPIVSESDTKVVNETLVILWVGEPNRWALFNKATRQSHVIIGAGADRKAAELRSKGIPAKVVNDSKQGQWPPQYDELMDLANKAHLEGRWPGGETWLTNVAEDERIRELIPELIKAIKEGNEKAVGRLVSERREGWAKSIIDEMPKTIRGGATPSMIRSIMIGKKDAMVVTEFFDYDEGPKRRGK